MRTVTTLAVAMSWFLPAAMSGQTQPLIFRSLAQLPGSVTAMVPGSAESRRVWVAAQDRLYEYSWSSEARGELEWSLVRQVPLPVRQITCGMLHPNQRQLLLGGTDAGESGSLLVVAVSSLQVEQAFEIHADGIGAVAVSQDGTHCATGSWDQTIGVVALETGQVRLLEGHTGGVRGLLWLDEGTLISAAEDHTLRSWDIQEGVPRRTWEQHTASIVAFVQSNQGTEGLVQVATAGRDRTVRWWQPQRGRMVRFIRLDWQPTALFGCKMTGSTWIGGERGEVARVERDGATLSQFGRLGGQSWVESLAIDGELELVGTNDGTIFEIISNK